MLERIRQAILTDGPMPVSLYMLMCLHDPSDGYYATRAGFNRDFTTSPEISQVFGELVGAWAAHEWQAMGSPSPFHLVELGPGRGTMMADMLRAARQAPGFIDAMKLKLVEASPMLRRAQAENLQGYAPQFLDGLDDLAEGPAIIIGNEFLDCLPIRQFVRRGVGWHECMIGQDDTGKLQWGAGPQIPAPEGVEQGSDYAHMERAPGMGTIVELLAAQFAAHPGRALFIDYGGERAPENTLRAYRNNRQVHPLNEPGLCDLTADVDFGRLKRLALKAGLAVHGPQEQGRFLQQLGLDQRAKQLAAANPERGEEILEAAGKLVDFEHNGMGERFKAICLAPAGTAPPPGF